MANLDCKKPKPCVPDEKPKEIYPPATPPFEQCVGDYTWKWDGTRMTRERVRHTPDGTYSTVTIVDGCPISYDYCPEPIYTPPYCNPNPTSCQSDTATGSADVTISPTADNSLSQSVNGLYAKTYIKGGNGVQVTGAGTVNSPYIVTANTTTTTGSTVAVVGRNGLVSETTTNGVTYVGLEPYKDVAGSYDINDKFTVDAYGRIKSVEQRSDPIVSAGAGLTTTQQGDSTVIEHPTLPNIDNSLVLGGYAISVNDTGHIVSTERGIEITGGTYNLGAYNVGINAYGSITAITQREDVMPSAGTFTANGKVFSYDVTGRLTGVDESGATTTTTDGLPLPLRDMYRVTAEIIGGSLGNIKKEIYGNDTQMSIGSGSTVRITVPSYVTQRSQIAVHGATSWELDILNGVVVVKPTSNENAPFTVAFRG